MGTKASFRSNQTIATFTDHSTRFLNFMTFYEQRIFSDSQLVNSLAGERLSFEATSFGIPLAQYEGANAEE